jgi:Tfp pilus assembly protein PilN
MITDDPRIQSINFIHGLSKLNASPITWRMILVSYFVVAVLLFTVLIPVKSYHAYLKGNSSDIQQRTTEKQMDIKKEQEKPNAQGGSYVTTLPRSFKASQVGFVPILTELSSHEMKYAWLTEISYSYFMDTIRFTGLTVEPTHINTLIQTLRQSRTLGKKTFEIIALEKPTVQLLNETYNLTYHSSRQDQEKGLLVTQFRQALNTLNPPQYNAQNKPGDPNNRENIEWENKIPYIFVIEHIPVKKTFDKAKS